MNIMLIILAEYIFVALLIILFYRLKPWFGLVPLFVLLGSNQYFQTVLATSFKVSLFNQYAVSPGAIILFSAGLFTILLLYIKEGSAVAQKLIFAIVLTNISFTILSYISFQQNNIAVGTVNFTEVAPDFFKVNYKIFVVGSIALIMDALFIVILYDLFYTRIKWLNLFFRLLLTMLIVLNFDAVIFMLGSFWGNVNLGNMLVSQLIGKSFSALFFASFLYLYLKYFDKNKEPGHLFGFKGKEDIFSILSYQGKYERLKTEKAISDEHLQAIISEKTAEQEKSLDRYTIMASVRELRIDKFTTAELAKEFLVKVQEAFDVDACTIHLIKNDELVMLTSVGITEHNKEYNLMFTFPYLQEMIKKKQGLFIEDTRNDPNFGYETQKDTNIFSYISCAGAPLLAGESVIGLLKLYTVHTKRSFSKIEMEHLQLVANQVAHSIEANVLFQQNEKHKEILVKQIIARKEAEEAIAKNEIKYRNLIESITDAFAAMDKNLCYTYINKKCGELLGRDPVSLIGKHIYTEFPEVVGQPFHRALEKAIKEQEVIHLEEFYAPYNKWFESHTYPSADGVSIFFTDITDRKNIEIEIIKIQKRFQNLVENIAGVYWVNDLETNQTLYISPSYEQVWGRICEDLYTNPADFLDSVYEEDKAILTDAYNNISNSRQTNIVYRIINGKKELRWINAKTNVVYNEQGHKIEYGYAEDITDRKNTSEAIRTAHERLVFHIENAPLGYIEWDNTFNLKSWSKMAETIFGWTESEFKELRKKKLPFVFEKDYNKVEEIDQQLLAGTHTNYKNINRNYTKSGKIIWCEWFNSALKDEEGNILTIMSLVQDITERKNTQVEIETYNIQLRQLTAHLQSIREEERRRIGREIHDDLGQQLTAIKMDTVWIDKKTSDSETLIKEKLKNIIELLDGSNQSVRRILSELKPSILDEYGLLDAMNWHGSQFASNTGIQNEIICSVKDIKLPENIATCIFRVFQESLTNITRYAKAKNVITSVKPSKDHISVNIQDDGIGFDISKIPGSGTFGILGMQERVSALDGKFSIKSEKGKGTLITLKIPYST